MKVELEQQPLVWEQELNELQDGGLNEQGGKGKHYEKEQEPAGALGQNVTTEVGGVLRGREYCARGVGKLCGPGKKQ